VLGRNRFRSSFPVGEIPAVAVRMEILVTAVAEDIQSSQPPVETQAVEERSQVANHWRLENPPLAAAGPTLTDYGCPRHIGSKRHFRARSSSRNWDT
jgi:hypothetical protein